MHACSLDACYEAYDDAAPSHAARPRNTLDPAEPWRRHAWRVPSAFAGSSVLVPPPRLVHAWPTCPAKRGYALHVWVILCWYCAGAGAGAGDNSPLGRVVAPGRRDVNSGWWWGDGCHGRVVVVHYLHLLKHLHSWDLGTGGAVGGGGVARTAQFLTLLALGGVGDSTSAGDVSKPALPATTTPSKHPAMSLSSSQLSSIWSELEISGCLITASGEVYTQSDATRVPHACIAAGGRSVWNTAVRTTANDPYIILCTPRDGTVGELQATLTADGDVVVEGCRGDFAVQQRNAAASRCWGRVFSLAAVGYLAVLALAW